jgi:peptidoglycan/xylan/chitin deacetylase (PgdA/CDA1 family)
MLFDFACKKAISLLAFLSGWVAFAGCADKTAGLTEIAKWPDGKRAAVSITYDDGTINQFRVAMPIMDRLGFPGTFFIVTGEIPGSQYKGQFIGRPVGEIIRETASVPTDAGNFYERASAVGYLGLRGTREYHTRAGGLYDGHKAEEAYAVIDEAYRRVRNGEFGPAAPDGGPGGETTWEDIRLYAGRGHEFGSHTITHPYLAALDEVNLLYELEKSREDILRELGPAHTFSAECPYGTENERVMEYAYPIYPALRNRMPEPWLEEINRWGTITPGMSEKEYVQWQRGPLSATPLPLMKSWIDTLAVNDHSWLVLVFHGVDGIGWEALPGAVLEEYFQYIKDREEHIWVATFGDVTKYIRQRMQAEIQVTPSRKEIRVEVRHPLDPAFYNTPLTLRTRVPARWKTVKVVQGRNEQVLSPELHDDGYYAQYPALPNSEVIVLSGL